MAELKWLEQLGEVKHALPGMYLTELTKLKAILDNGDLETKVQFLIVEDKLHYSELLEEYRRKEAANG